MSDELIKEIKERTGRARDLHNVDLESKGDKDSLEYRSGRVGQVGQHGCDEESSSSSATC